MNTPRKEETKSTALNWVDYADSIRRSAWQQEFASGQRPAAPEKAERPARPAVQDRRSKPR